MPGVEGLLSVEAIASYFKFSERNTTLATEAKAGLTTFMVMAYILLVNPSILRCGRDPVPAAAAATALVAGLLTIAMGLIANVPIALAAGLGINGAVAFGLVLTSGLTPAGAMGVIVLEGLIVTILVLVGLREAIMRAVPLSLKRAIGVGIGLFILFIGFVDGGIIVKTLGTSAENPVPVDVRLPDRAGPLRVLARPAAHDRPVGPQGPGGAADQHPRHDGRRDRRRRPAAADDLHRDAGLLDARPVRPDERLHGPRRPRRRSLTIFSFMLTDFFDTMGTATAISEQAGLVDEEGQPENVGPDPARRLASPPRPAARPASARTRATSRARQASPRAAGPASRRS